MDLAIAIEMKGWSEMGSMGEGTQEAGQEEGGGVSLTLTAHPANEF